jgi:GAF domain-containing protein
VAPPDVAIEDDTLPELLALAGVAIAHDDIGDALREITRIATRAVRNAAGASLTSIGASGPEVAAASDPWAERLDSLQYEEREGPCLDAARTGLVFRVRDMSLEPRWPSYMPRAAAHGARSMVSIPLTTETKITGALNVYSRQVDAFGSEEVSVAEVIAGHASLATQVAATLHDHRAIAEQLRSALASRATIEQAKGIIMATLRCDADTAFRRLVEQSQHENRKLRDVADAVVRHYGA